NELRRRCRSLRSDSALRRPPCSSTVRSYSGPNVLRRLRVRHVRYATNATTATQPMTTRAHPHAGMDAPSRDAPRVSLCASPHQGDLKRGKRRSAAKKFVARPTRARYFAFEDAFFAVDFARVDAFFAEPFAALLAF